MSVEAPLQSNGISRVESSALCCCAARILCCCRCLAQILLPAAVYESHPQWLISACRPLCTLLHIACIPKVRSPGFSNTKLLHCSWCWFVLARSGLLGSNMSKSFVSKYLAGTILPRKQVFWASAKFTKLLHWCSRVSHYYLKMHQAAALVLMSHTHDMAIMQARSHSGVDNGQCQG